MDLPQAPGVLHEEEIISNHPTRQDNAPRLWMPRRVVFTAEAFKEPYGKEIYDRVSSYHLPVEILKNNRLTGLRGATDRETYKIAKTTLAIVKAPPGAFRLWPIPPSADWQFHLAEGCPAHCQYCYLAGSLSGPPAIRVFANLPGILENLKNYEQPGKMTSFEASCYTDPLSIEHLTGGLERTLNFFSNQQYSHLRFVTKFDAVGPLMNITHNGCTRCRISLNAESVARRLEGGTPQIAARIKALRKLALPVDKGGGNYPVGVILAPIMPIPKWKEEYGMLLEQLQQSLDFPCDLTFELITHRFTPGSKDVLSKWYPNSSLEMDEHNRSVKRTKFGGLKYVYPREVMKSLKEFLEMEIRTRFPHAGILYWT